MDARTKRAAKVDTNQKEIVSLMRQMGMEVEILGMPSDLLVGKYMITVVAEVKNPKQPPSKRRLTDQEYEFYRKWHKKALYCVIETDADVVLLNRALNDGLQATKKFCNENMEAHFETCYATL